MFWLINCLIGALTKHWPRRPDGSCDSAALDRLLWQEKAPSEEELLEALEPVFRYIENRNDCSDFQALKLLYLLYESVPGADNVRMKTCLCGMPHWITDADIKSMCVYSENHQLCFAVAEYLTAQFYGDAALHAGASKARAAERLDIWFELRARFGMSEWLSNNYLPVDIGALSLLILFADNEGLRSEAKRALDRILGDYADALFQNTFVNASARDYPRNLQNSEEAINSRIVIEALWGDRDRAWKLCEGKITLFFVKLLQKGLYSLPEEVQARAMRTELETKKRFGLATERYQEEGLLGLATRSLMMQLGSGALTNPAIIKNTYQMMRRYKLWHHDFLWWLRFLESPLLRVLGLMPWASETFNYFQNGMSLEQADVYCYRNEYYKISALEKYFPGSSGAQKTSVVVTLPGGITVHTNHPLKMRDEDRSPSYFGGYGVAPEVHAEKDGARVEYRLPLFARAFAPGGVIPLTHTYLPQKGFDELSIEEQYAFGRVGDSFLALQGSRKLEYKNGFDLIQRGRKAVWTYYLSDITRESFAEFKERVKKV